MKVMRIMIKIQNWLGIPHFTREANFPWNRPIGTCHRWVDLLIEGCGGRFALDKFTMSNLVPKATLPSHLQGFLFKIHYCMTWSEKKGLHLASINYLWINNQNIPFFRLEIYQLNLEYLKPTMMFTYSMVLRVGLLATRFPLDVLSQFDVSFLANNLAVHVVQTSPLDVLGKMCYVTTNKNSRLLRVNCNSCEYNKSCTKKPVCAVMYHHIFYNYLHIIVAPPPPPLPPRAIPNHSESWRAELDGLTWKKPSGFALTRLHCIFRERSLKLWTSTCNKTNEKTGRACFDLKKKRKVLTVVSFL